ncbi:putative dopa decarboxylase protein remnant [Klebsiella pneumoniae]|uniref:hypothetical protein n=1 Tax=Klebsiella pneumoniae TaxID=573 RepID=UPI000E2C0765|nr:hypothetical protein [Klebsiella pneumoniae]SYT49017.1 putative dopa decarboxylase protein remnant [Klebsiella pneumoniae]SYU12040.1 putative dopa decarboxylase protein remnant [Klebsiella pneumoniae]
MSFKPGFIPPPWPHTPGDSVSAESLIQRIEKEANHGCGLYYEIYQYRAMRELQQTLANLSANDADTFMKVAASRGFHLNESAIRETRKAYHETMEEIRREQE